MTVKSKSKPIVNVASTAEKVEHTKLSDIAYGRVLEGLFDRSIPVGSFVSQASLVEKLDIPMQPLRDALRVLEAEGVLSVHPRSGIEFLKPDLELARSTYQFRTIIERAAARHCATAGDAAYFSQLIKEHEALIASIEGGAFDDSVLVQVEALEQRLHGGMLESLNNPLVSTTARRLKNYVRLIRLERLMTPPLVLQSLQEHLILLDAIVRRDDHAAEEALSAHFRASLQRILGMF